MQNKLVRPAVCAAPWFCAALATLLVALFYGPALGFDLVWDDQIWVNEFRRHDLPTLLHANLTGNTLVSYYRPLVAALLSLQLALSQSPVYLHALNIVVHLCNLLLVIALARRQRSARPACLLPLVVALLAIHPVLVEPVVWVSGRFDLIYTSFLLLALWAALGIEATPLRFVVVTLAFFAAVCSKESALAYLAVGPLLLAALRHAEGVPRSRIAMQAAWHGGALLTAAVAYLALRVFHLQLTLVRDTAFQLQPGGSDGHHLLLVLRTFGTYLQMTLLPLWNLAPLHEMSGKLAVIDGYTGLGVLALSLAAAGLRWPALLPCTVWALALAPAANLVPFRLDIVQNRYLYFPLFAAMLALLSTQRAWRFDARAARLSWLLLALWLAALAVTNVSIARLWRNGVTLFSWMVSAEPGSRMALENLALAHQTAGNFAQAIEVEQRVPDKARSFQGRLLMARATRDQGDLAGALVLYKTTLATPAYDAAMEVSAMFELALVQQQLGDPQSSAAQAAAAEALARQQRVSERLCDYYRQALKSAAPRHGN